MFLPSDNYMVSMRQDLHDPQMRGFLAARLEVSGLPKGMLQGFHAGKRTFDSGARRLQDTLTTVLVWRYNRFTKMYIMLRPPLPAIRQCQ